MHLVLLWLLQNDAASCCPGFTKMIWLLKTSVAKPHHFYAAPAQGENFDPAPAPAPAAPTLLWSKAKFLK
jgi:hypothetical protein